MIYNFVNISRIRFTQQWGKLEMKRFQLCNRCYCYSKGVYLECRFPHHYSRLLIGREKPQGNNYQSTSATGTFLFLKQRQVTNLFHQIRKIWFDCHEIAVDINKTINFCFNFLLFIWKKFSPKSSQYSCVCITIQLYSKILSK